MFLCFFLKVQKWPKTEMILRGRGRYLYSHAHSISSKFTLEAVTVFHLE